MQLRKVDLVQGVGRPDRIFTCIGATGGRSRGQSSLSIMNWEIDDKSQMSDPSYRRIPHRRLEGDAGTK